MKPFSSLSSLSLLALATAAPFGDLEPRSKYHPQKTEKLYARAEVISEVYGIHAHFEFTGRLDGWGTFVKVQVLSGLLDNSPIIQGPFLYHVHSNPIIGDANCSTALGHLDPLNVTESLVCDPAFPQYCQEGDLAGKHGKLNGTDNGIIESFGYTDDYLRFFPADFSLLGRSIVIHSSNKTRLACGNIISTLDGTADHNLQPTNKPSNFVTKYPTEPPFNPPQVVTPLVGTVFPAASVIDALPFPFPNKALSLQEALNVVLTVNTTTVFVNGTQTTASLPAEKQTSAKPPFRGYWDNSWV